MGIEVRRGRLDPVLTGGKKPGNAAGLGGAGPTCSADGTRASPIPLPRQRCDGAFGGAYPKGAYPNFQIPIPGQNNRAEDIQTDIVPIYKINIF